LFNYTADATATATFQLSPVLSSRTSAGAQYLKDVLDRNGASGEDLAPGSTTISSGVIPNSRDTTDITKTVGAYVEQQFGYKDRLFVTGGLRVDDNSAFGVDFQAVYYPKLSVSYVISEEPYFPKWSWINSVRLRGAIGASGVQPATTDALRFFEPRRTSVDNADTPGIIFSALGNPNLATEVSYLNGRVVPRGTAGSVRLDVVEGPLTAPTAIFDLKTGSATLTPARVQQIQQHIPGGATVPVLEIR